MEVLIRAPRCGPHNQQHDREHHFIINLFIFRYESVLDLFVCLVVFSDSAPRNDPLIAFPTHLLILELHMRRLVHFGLDFCKAIGFFICSPLIFLKVLCIWHLRGNKQWIEGVLVV